MLIGFLLVSLTIGPYNNGDTLREYDAVTSILKTGLPVISDGYLMDEPPVGFYIHALLFKLFGASIENGLLTILLLGLGCIALVYAIGTVAYNKTTGFFAALLFAFTPWHLILSRSFLIDVPCLFFSLLCLLTGLLAFRRGSLWLLLLAGIFFALAFNTKLYAVFVLIPLIALYFHLQAPKLKHIAVWFVVFSIPAVISTILWYQVIAGVGLSAIYVHGDLTTHYSNMVSPTPLFAFNFLVSYGVGWFFIDAVILSLFIVFWQRRIFKELLVIDTICIATVICILAVNTFLGAVLDLKPPYLNAIKYDYQALPFLSFLTGGLVTKNVILLKLKQGNKKNAISLITVALGFFLIAAAIFYNFRFINMFSGWDYLIFRVAPGINEGYSLFNPNPIADSYLLLAQFLGFAIALSGIFYVSRHKLRLLLNRKKVTF
jgi:4-amino-4-deoxy-L-arabinose transferase-like glycosyltransferase